MEEPAKAPVEEKKEEKATKAAADNCECKPTTCEKKKETAALLEDKTPDAPASSGSGMGTFLMASAVVAVGAAAAFFYV